MDRPANDDDTPNPTASIQLLASGALLMRDAAKHGELDQVLAISELMLGVARPWTQPLGSDNE